MSRETEGESIEEKNKFSAFKVNKIRIWKPNIQYLSIFYNDRIVFAKIGSQLADVGLGTITGVVLGGAVGSLIGSAIDKKMRKSSEKEKGEKMKEIFEMSHGEILALDKDNFEILYDDISGVKIKKSFLGASGARTGTISIEGKKKESFDIAPNQSFEICEGIIREYLANKLT